MLFHLVYEGGVVFGIGHHGDEGMVLGRCSDKRHPADVDGLDRPRPVGAPGDHVLEGIEIDHHKIDAPDAVFGHLADMIRGIAASQDPSVNGRMECLHAAIQDLGKPRDLADGGDGQALGDEGRGGAAR